MEKLILLLLVLALTGFFYTILKLSFKGRQKPIERLEKYSETGNSKGSDKKKLHKDYKAGLSILTKGIGNARFLDGYKKSIQLKLLRAHVLLKPEEYIAVCIGVALLFGIILTAAAKNLLLFPLGATVGWLIPSLIIKSKIKKRLKLLNEQLNDAIVMISNSLKAGYSFFQAVETVSREMTGPISEEFLYLQKEINLGQSTEKALENLTSRVASEDLDLVITAVLIQRQAGGNLSEILDNISFTIRERIKIKGEIRTITAQGRMSGMVISLIPPILCVVLYMINPEQIGMLFKTTLGNIILVTAAVMELIGIFAIKKIVNIKF
ncbi:MAG: type II secretion system F family protein [Bacillota bacterium]|nr:type II secretion system F family protein [Bacillota bacterium]